MLLVLSLKGGSHSFISFWARIVNQGSGFLTYNGFKVIFFFRERERERGIILLDTSMAMLAFWFVAFHEG
jgi:hypothetical protein